MLTFHQPFPKSNLLPNKPLKPHLHLSRPIFSCPLSMASNKENTQNPPTSKYKRVRFVSGCFGFGSYDTNLIASNSRKKGQDPSSIKPKKASWALGRFGLGSLYRNRTMVNQPVERAVERWFREIKKRRRSGKKNKAKERDHMVVEEVSKGGEALETKKTSMFDDESIEVHELSKGDCNEEFGYIKDNVLAKKKPTSIKLKSVREDSTKPWSVKIQKLASEEDPKSYRRLISANQPQSKNARKSNKDAILGLTVVVLALAVMLLCGRVYAPRFGSIACRSSC